jgi:hypothetical protein
MHCIVYTYDFMFKRPMDQTREAGRFTARLETQNLCFRACFAM